MRDIWVLKAEGDFITMNNNLTKNDVKQLIREFILRSSIEENINDDQNLNELGLMHSLFGMYLILYIEKEFDVSLDATLMNFNIVNSINKIVELVCGY